MLPAYVGDWGPCRRGEAIDTQAQNTGAYTPIPDDRPDGGQPKKFLRPCALLLLKESPAHGYDLLERLAAFGFPRDPGGLYRALRSLEVEGLVRSAWQTSANGHERRTYELTHAGERWLHSWASTLEGSRRVLDRFLGRYQEAVHAPSAIKTKVSSKGGAHQMGESTRTLDPASRAGMVRFVHYSFMPNRLGYCGPDQNSLLFQYGIAGEADPGLPPVLTKFLGPLPYLRTIASAAGIADIFDDRVVEAYWIGNSLLDHVNARELDTTLRARFAKELSPKLMEMVAGKVPQGARPHHSFHVFDVWRQVGRLEGNVLATMDNCRIGWGRVKSVDGATVLVDRQPLIMQEGKLALGPTETSQALRLFDGRGFVTTLTPGAMVSLHWGWVCEQISEDQARALERYTGQHLAIANQTI
jgi:poly-beta-hydroxybutyrate-responsive repressor